MNISGRTWMRSRKQTKRQLWRKTSPGRGENVDVLGGKPLGVAALRQESWDEEAGTSSWGLDPPLSLRLLYAARYKSHCGVLSGGGPSADLHCSEVSLALWWEYTGDKITKTSPWETWRKLQPVPVEIVGTGPLYAGYSDSGSKWLTHWKRSICLAS